MYALAIRSVSRATSDYNLYKTQQENPGLRRRMSTGLRIILAGYTVALYKAHQTKEGHWIWKFTGEESEPQPTKAKAMKLVDEFSDKHGQCQFIFSDRGIGGRRIG